MAVDLPFPGLVDIRQPILGDSFGWAGLEPAAAKKVVDFHHSASDAPAEDGFSIADYHVNHNGWGGIGYHFVITRSDYPGRQGFTSPGAQIQYVGDLGTWRAHVANNNPGHVGVCFVGIEPTQDQLRLGRALMDFFIAPNNILPSINFGNQATVHQLDKDPLSPTGLQQTDCPGTTFPEWLPYIQGGDFPAYLNPPLPTPVEVAPVAEVPTAPLPEYEATYHDQTEQKTIARDGAHGVDVTTGAVVVPSIPVGTVIDVAGYFTYQGVTYARTVYSKTNNKWNGLDVIYFEPPTGQPSGDIPISTPPVATPAPDPIVIPDTVASDVTDQALQEATVPETPKMSVLDLLKELFAQIIAKIIRKK